MSERILTPERSMAEFCLSGAREHERLARELRTLASKIIDPPEGVTVEVGGSMVRFISPVLTAEAVRDQGGGE